MARDLGTPNTTPSAKTKPADFWINLAIPLKNEQGEVIEQQFAGIPLDEEDPVHALLIPILQEDPDKFADIIKLCKVTLTTPKSKKLAGQLTIAGLDL